jgi:hypothetical protein
VTLTVENNQVVEPPDPWRGDGGGEADWDDGEGWKDGRPNPLGPAG